MSDFSDDFENDSKELPINDNKNTLDENIENKNNIELSFQTEEKSSILLNIKKIHNNKEEYQDIGYISPEQIQEFIKKPLNKSDPKDDIIKELKNEIEKFKEQVITQRHIIDSQKDTIKLLMNEQINYEEITKLRQALSSKNPLLQLVAATPLSESRTVTQLKAENASLRRQIDEIENRHLTELRNLKTQFVSLSSRPIPIDGCAICKRKIRELENQLKNNI